MYIYYHIRNIWVYAPLLDIACWHTITMTQSNYRHIKLSIMYLNNFVKILNNLDSNISHVQHCVVKRNSEKCSIRHFFNWTHDKQMIGTHIFNSLGCDHIRAPSGKLWIYSNSVTCISDVYMSKSMRHLSFSSHETLIPNLMHLLVCIEKHCTR